MPNGAGKGEVGAEEWGVGETVNATVGQGYLLASPLQLAVMSARLATGRSVEPRLIKAVDGVDTPLGTGDDIGVDPANLRLIQEAIYDTVNDRKGTAYGSRVIDDSVRIAGKTGTSQVRNITAEERRAGVWRNEDLPWERRDHALFVNYAPYDAPQIAVSVVVEHGGGGSKAAAPIARDITMQALYGGEPPVDVYPVKDRDLITKRQEELRRVRPVADVGGSDQA